MGRGTATHIRGRDFEDITPEPFKVLGAGAVFELPDGRYAVRGEMVHCFRAGDTPEATVIIDPKMLYAAIPALRGIL